MKSRIINKKGTLAIIVLTVIILISGIVLATMLAKGDNAKNANATLTTVPSTVSTTALTTTTTATTTTTQAAIDVSKLDKKKVVCLCFDDGPSPRTTTKLLDGLKKRNAHATFFMLGANAKANPDIVKRIVREGHSVGNHSANHGDLTALDSEEKVRREIDKSAKMIEQAGGVYPKHFRPPYGNFNNKVKAAVYNLNMDMIYWNVDPKDWSTKNAERVCAYIIKDAGDGGDIVCVHDIYQTTVDGVLRAIDTMQANGYQFISIDEFEQLMSGGFVRGRMWFSGHEYYDYKKPAK